MHRWIIEALEVRRRPYAEMHGSPGKRLAAAVETITPSLQWPALV